MKTIDIGNRDVKFYLKIADDWYYSDRNLPLSMGTFMKASIVFDDQFNILKTEDSLLYIKNRDVRTLMSESEVSNIILSSSPLSAYDQRRGRTYAS